MARRSWRAPFGAVLVAVSAVAAVAAGLAGCRGGGGDQLAAVATTTTERPNGGATAPAPGRVPSSSTPTSTSAASATATSGSAGNGPAAVDAPADLTAAEVCERLPAALVAEILGTAVTSTPSSSSTPQCSYAFTNATGVATEATVAALRAVGDLQGRVGVEAYEHVVEVNRIIAAGEVVETPIDAGDDAVVLTGGSLHLAIVRFDQRIVTVLLPTGGGDVTVVANLADGASALSI